MKAVVAGLLGLVIALNGLTAALAQRGGGGRPAGGGGGGGAARSAPAQRPAAPAPRPAAPAPRPAAPAQRPQPPVANTGRPPSGGFNFNNDYKPANPPANRPNNPPANRPNNPPANRPNNPPANRPNQPANRPQSGNRPPPPGYRPPAGHTAVVVRPVYPPGPAWGWNRGVVWAPAPYYWGGGFWGSLAIGVTSAAVAGAVMGSIVASDNATYNSYQVQPNSPGAQMLAAYQLQQVPCGPPDLVVIYGPDNSVICANPNNLVAPGYYNLDTSTLTLTSQ